jgi:hypothetical protein
MTTFANHNDLEPNPGHEPPPLTSSQAMRFLLRHRLGRLVTENLISGDTHVTPIHYVLDDGGALLALLPAASEHALALRHRPTANLLSIGGELPPEPHRLSIPGDESIWHVQADVEVDVVRDVDGVRAILAGQIHSVLADLPQADKSDPMPRATPSELATLIGVRLRITGVRVHTHRHTHAAA